MDLFWNDPLHNHVPEFLKLYKNIEYFTQQSMEKYNDKASKDYFRPTNHHGASALEQLFLKQNRVQRLSRIGCERVKKVTIVATAQLWDTL